MDEAVSGEAEDHFTYVGAHGGANESVLVPAGGAYNPVITASEAEPSRLFAAKDLDRLPADVGAAQIGPTIDSMF